MPDTPSRPPAPPTLPPEAPTGPVRGSLDDTVPIPIPKTKVEDDAGFNPFKGTALSPAWSVLWPIARKSPAAFALAWCLVLTVWGPPQIPYTWWGRYTVQGPRSDDGGWREKDIAARDVVNQRLNQCEARYESLNAKIESMDSAAQVDTLNTHIATYERFRGVTETQVLQIQSDVTEAKKILFDIYTAMPRSTP